MSFSIRDSEPAARCSLSQDFTIGLVFSVFCAVLCTGCELVLGSIPDAAPANEAGISGAAGATGSGGAQGQSGSGGATGAGGSGGSGAGGQGGQGGVAGSGGSTACDCDCDGDGYQKAIGCGGDDCDDAELNAHPGQMAYFATPTRGTNMYDYDCDGNDKRQYPNVDCMVPVGVLCPTTRGYLDKTLPECGTLARLGSCTLSGVNCLEQVDQSGVMVLCR